MFSFNLFASDRQPTAMKSGNCISVVCVVYTLERTKRDPVRQHREIRRPYYSRSRALRIKYHAHNREHDLAHDHDPFLVHAGSIRVRIEWFAILAGPEIDLQCACSLEGCRPLLIRFHRRMRPFSFWSPLLAARVLRDWQTTRTLHS